MLNNFYKISKILRVYANDTDAELRDMGHHVRHSPLFTFFFGKEKARPEPEKRSKKSI